MGSPSARSMFHNLTFQKSSGEIREKATAKAKALEDKVTEREERIVRIRKEFGITDADMINLLSQAAQEAISNARVATSMSYNLGGQGGETRIIAAGVVQNLLTERTLIEQEKDSIEKLRLIVRNIGPVRHHAANTGAEYTDDWFTLSESDLDYLGF